MEITYHGHSCVQITEGGHSLIIDPFLSGNPQAVAKPEDIKVRYVLLTHAHSDHIQNAVEIAKANDATVIATFELANYMSWQGVKTEAINIGGAYRAEFGQFRMVQAFHSSGLVLADKQEIVYMGMPAGFLVTMGNRTVLHCGDTCLFGDMRIIGDRNNIDVAFVPMGDTFTMGPEDAVLAAEWLKAHLVVPVHYNTFPAIEQSGETFVRMLKERDIRGIAMVPGETLQL